MRPRSRRPLLLLALAAAGCSMFRISGYYYTRKEGAGETGRAGVLEPFLLPTREEEEEAFRVSASTQAAPRETFTEQDLAALYYYDLGPSEIDVADYPRKQQENYALFRQVCSKCHTLARPINSPRSGYWAWDFYIFNMRLRGQFDRSTAFTQAQAKQILDFLVYDSKVRKGESRAAFEVLNKRLERRFYRMLDEKVRRTQRGRPILPPSRD